MKRKGVIREISALLIFSSFFGSCSVPRAALDISGDRKIWARIAKDSVFSSQHTGFALYDPVRGKMLCEYQSGKYFTPASTTKILTLLTCLHVLPDSVETLRYAIRNDTLIFHGMADPSFLRRDIPTSAAPYDLLESFDGVLAYQPMTPVKPFGPGWAWDDVAYAFQTERCVFPVSGNCVEVVKRGELEFRPKYFKQAFHEDSLLARPLSRNVYVNGFYVNPEQMKPGVVYRVPFRITDAVTISLLREFLNRSVVMRNHEFVDDMKTVYGTSRDTLLKIMMHDSDNAIAEQLLMQCAYLMRGTFEPDTAIALSLHALLRGMPDHIRWVDGSGLSRYNMVTPRSLVHALDQISSLQKMDYLMEVFPIGGVSGTIRDSFGGDPPYLYAKSGSLRNQYCLAGYLKTRKGKWLIFSFLNGNFHTSVQGVKVEMEKILRDIHQRY